MKVISELIQASFSPNKSIKLEAITGDYLLDISGYHQDKRFTYAISIRIGLKHENYQRVVRSITTDFPDLLHQRIRHC